MAVGDPYRVTVCVLNVRQSPSITAEVIGYVQRDEVVTCLDVSGDGYWFKIEMEDLKGWAAQRFLQYVLDPAPVEKFLWMPIALAEVGVKELPGDGDNPRILEYLQSTRLGPPANSKDETHWCSAFVNWCIEKAGYEGTDSARARSWLTWGKSIATPERGCIAVLQRNQDPQGGHVGFFLEENEQQMALLGGNQSNAVRTSWYDYADCLGFRLPGR
ncbi:MAG TPA: TIGR02594 family protein [bacterium]|nr:TIGR02594 family protein [bacterium]